MDERAVNDSIMLSDEAFKQPAWLAATLVGVALWLPFSWVVWIDYPWNDYRYLWLKLLPILPGIVPAAFLGHFLSFGDTGLYAIMAAFTLGFASLFIWWGSRGGVSLCISIACSLTISIPSAVYSYQLMRA